MQEVDVKEFQQRCSALIEQVRKTRKPIRVTREGKPIAEITPAAPPRTADWIGSMKNKSMILGDIVGPAAPESDWEVLRDEPHANTPSQRPKRRRQRDHCFLRYPG